MFANLTQAKFRFAGLRVPELGLPVAATALVRFSSFRQVQSCFIPSLQFSEHRLTQTKQRRGRCSSHETAGRKAALRARRRKIYTNLYMGIKFQIHDQYVFTSSFTYMYFHQNSATRDVCLRYDICLRCDASPSEL